MTERRRSPRPPDWTLAAGASLAAFLVVLALLAFQMGAGRDPALGAGKPAATADVARARHVLVRRVIVTRRVIVIRAPAVGPVTALSASRPAGAPSAAPAAPPVAPAPAARPAAPAPAPAPAPPTVVTRSS